MRVPLAEALFHVKLEDLGVVEPLCAGVVEFPIPPTVGSPAIVRMRYLMYRHARGIFFDFIKDDVEPLSVPVQAWICMFRDVLHHQLMQHVEAFFSDVYTPQQLTLFSDAETPRPPVQ